MLSSRCMPTRSFWCDIHFAVDKKTTAPSVLQEGRGDSLLAIFATCYMRYKYSEWPMRYSDWFAACYMRYNEHLACSVLSLTDTLHIYILTFTLQFFPSMERNLSKDAKHRLGLNNETRYSPIYLFPICFHNDPNVTQDLWDENPFQVYYMYTILLNFFF